MTDFDRYGKITASVVSAILRCEGEKKSRKWAYRCIMGLEKEREPGFDIQRGLDHEEDAVAYLESKLGLLVDDGRFVCHRSIDWLGASPDGFLMEGGVAIPVEAKCPRQLHVKIPPMYYAQVQTQIEVCDAPYAYFISWVENSDVQYVERVIRDSKWWDEAYPQLESFYTDFIAREIEPPKSTRRSTTKEK